MSDIVNKESRHSVYGGIIIDIAEDSVGRTRRLLESVKGGWHKAIGSALARSAAAGKTVAKKAIADEYTLPQGAVLKNTRTINHHTSDFQVVFGFAGNVIPLIKFNTRVGRNGAVTAQVKRENAAKALDNAFRTSVGSHMGIFERVSQERLPIRELYGPATPQMMLANEAVLDKIEDKMVETYEKRIEQEILRLLNGWG